MSWNVPIDARTEQMFPPPLKGTITTHRFTSSVLRGNPWGDPIERDVPVYVPPSGHTEGRPLLVLLSGYSGSGPGHFRAPEYLRESLVARLDRLIRTGAAAEAVMVGPDCLTTLGGSQYLNSSATGRYEDYVVQEIVPMVQEKYRTGPTVTLGTSSGGYGALVLALRHPRLFRAAASNAGDMYFEYCYPPDFPHALRAIRKAGGPAALLHKLFHAPVDGFGPRNEDVQALSTMAYASCYSPIDSEPGRFDLPFDLDSGEIRDGIWAKWLAWDPVRMIREERYRSALRSLAYIYADGGLKDEFGLDVASRVFAAEARRQGVSIDHQEFAGGHFDKGPRYDIMIPRLLAAVGFPTGT